MTLSRRCTWKVSPSAGRSATPTTSPRRFAIWLTSRFAGVTTGRRPSILRRVSPCTKARTPARFSPSAWTDWHVYLPQSLHEQAARLFGAAEASLEALGGRLPMWTDVSERGGYIARTRAGLGDKE